MKRVLFWFLWLVLMAVSVASLNSAHDDFRIAEGLGQNVVTWSAFTNGLSGIAAAIGMLMRKKWCLMALIVWGVSCTVAATVATVAYGEAPIYAAIAGGACTAVIAVLVYFGVRKVVS